MGERKAPIIKKTYHEGYELGIKRFYAPYVISIWCDTCKEMIDFDLMDYDLHDPTINEEEEVKFTCQECYEEVESVNLRIDVVVSLVGCRDE